MRYLVLLFASAAVHAADIDYHVTFDNAVHHEARITVTVDAIDEDSVVFVMSRSSPGRYAEHDFAKNVYSVSAVDGKGATLDVRRVSPHAWEVSGHDGTIALGYTLYADRVDGTYSAIDATHAHLNMPASFMWPKGYGKRPVRIAFEPASADWKVATQLAATDDPYRFTAPDLYYFLDSPVELSDFVERRWTIGEAGQEQTIRLVVHHDGNADDIDELERRTRLIVDEQIRIFGEAPAFDYGEYTFICDFLPYADSDGMEHRNSTIVSKPESLLDGDFRAHQGTISHEFMHAWNVERLRPADLEPFDFERANPSENLWFAEGFTSYYGNLALRRAGLISIEDFLDVLESWINTVSHSPGRAYRSPVQMSLMAPFRDAATAIDRTNFDNTFVSYYTYGAYLAATLDLMLRSEYDSTLDELMRQLWQEYGRRERTYALRDLEVALARLTGDASFARRFFARHVEGSELPDMAGLLSAAGIELRKADGGEAWLGAADIVFDGPDAIVDTPTHVGSPLYAAGVDRGDQLLSVGRYRIRSQKHWERLAERLSPGESVTIRYLQRGIEKEAELLVAEDPSFRLETRELEDRRSDRPLRAFRNAWLGDE